MTRGSRTSCSRWVDVELTARCNNDCRHCYINPMAGDSAARAAEMSTAEVLDIAGQATE